MGGLIGGSVAVFLTLCILSRAVGENPFYRFAQSVFIGTAIGYITAVIVRDVLILPIDVLIFSAASLEQWAPMIAGLVLGILLITRFGPQWGSHLANLPLALLVGTGAAIALIGTVRGTLVPVLLATLRIPLLTDDLRSRVGAFILVLLTITTLLAFRYTSSPSRANTARRPRPQLLAGLVHFTGRGAVLVTFGVFFAAAVTTYISALVGQLAFISAWSNALWAYLIGT
jgi:hypothetical protein